MSFETVAQQTIFATLNGNVSANVYDDVPYLPEGMPRENFPYIVIGDDSLTAWDTDETLGTQIEVELHVWSRSAGFKEAKTIMGEIYTLLHMETLTATGYKIVDSLCTFSDAMRDPDGETRHGVMRFLLTVQKTS